MADFKKFQKIIADTANKLFARKERPFRSNTAGHYLGDLYVGSFPGGTNPIFRERTEHDCNCCKRFIRDVGNVVWFTEKGEVLTIWDEAAKTAEYPYNVVSEALRTVVVGNAVVQNAEPFYHYSTTVGDQTTKELVAGGKDINWDHFHCVIPPQYVTRMDNLSQEKEKVRAQIQVALRSVTELDMGALEFVTDLIKSDQLPRGPEYKQRVATLVRKKKQLESSGKDVTVLVSNMSFDELVAVSLRNTLIGSLLVDISGGRDIEEAVRAYDKNAAPENFRRSSPVVTTRMKEGAKKRVKELGIEASLPRRAAVASDLSVNDVKFVDTSIKPLQDSVLDVLDSVVKKQVDPKKLIAKDIPAVDFFKTVVPTASTMEVLFTGKHKVNLMTLIAPANTDAPNILKWDNNFSWSFNGDITDASSLTERVKKHGGKTDAPMRVSLGWYNSDDLDLHVKYDGNRLYYGDPRSRDGNAHLDRDMNVCTGGNNYSNTDPIENVYWKKVPSSEVTIAVCNFTPRNNKNVGCEFEVLLNGTLRTFTYDKAVRGSFDVLRVNPTTGKITILQNGVKEIGRSEEVWNINTEEFVPVHLITSSPNCWGDKVVGNPLHFFILKDCLRPDACRGLYTEFLMQELQQDRKVFEVLGSMLLAPYSDQQLSGLGFNQTTRSELVCRVVHQNGMTKLYNIKF